MKINIYIPCTQVIYFCVDGICEKQERRKKKKKVIFCLL